MRLKEKERERNKAETETEKKDRDREREKEKELDTCKAWVAQLVVNKSQDNLQFTHFNKIDIF
jgi:hypothetical protein